MKINEIEYGHWSKPTLPENSIISPSKIVDNFDGYNIHEFNPNNLIYLLILDELTKQYMGYVRVTDLGNDYVFNELYVPTQYRRKGIATIIILSILRKLKKKLILDKTEIVTDDSRQVFFKLASLSKIQIKSNGQQLTTQELSKLFIDISDNETTLVIEGLSKTSTNFEIRNLITNLAESNDIQFGGEKRIKIWFD
jgi:hypothetical protein